MKRLASLTELSSRPEPFDIVIVGGGASGLGAAVDAAVRGHSVLLVEQSDFAKGTSSRSTKLVHGGVRYLKQGNVSLVLEALRERGLMCRNAPHLVHSLPFVIPNYHWWEGPFYGIGMKVYDGLAGRLGLEPSRYLNREDVIELLPNIEQQDLTGGIIYHDGQFDDSRLAINLAQTAAEKGAVVLNYVRCAGLIKEGPHVAGVKLQDAETGEEAAVRAKVVINATGVFADEVRRMDDPQAKTMLSPSQGIHFVLPREFLPGDTAIMIPKTDDGRVLFAVPWHGRVVVGTTDTPVENASLEPRALEAEIEFIFTQITRYLTRDPTRADVLSVYAGLRPLIKSDASSTAALSRDHLISISDSGLITLAGGKWTTYRKMAEDVIDHAEMIGALDHRYCATHELKIHGAEVTEAEASHLHYYGSDAPGIRALIQNDPTLGEVLHPKLEFLKAEIIWHVRHEMARTVEDVLSRRTRALLLDARSSLEAAPIVARLMAQELDRDTSWEQAQVSSYETLAKGYLLPA
ncbi:FAD-dependent oxidoreductase [Prosthecobacter dejongeii]|uniref:Glycerol-3-phosphate dehydrogenase n=1 Tax=Prosthecobacter dejongeii TaxID=48465 RepID=A0A7W7YQC5_9BACT|nr:glycerol-3-phosphate dehydrogenase/oxidase [Prosthecobacter dejongeii]MBB5040242.1 glycerol-3-phosphate dehydrogenase [Prosthecobacter dejongeii]